MQLRTVEFGTAEWSAFLTAELGRPVEVFFSRARKTPVTLTRTDTKSTLRMNAFFGAAPPEVRQAMAAWLRSGRRAKRALRTLDDWIEQRLELLAREQPRALSIRPRGEVYDLTPLSEGLRAKEFAGELGSGHEPKITWGRAGKSRGRHSLRLGSYDYQTGVVRIHTVLDQTAVPIWFVRYVLFHELLHAALPCPAKSSNGRVVHGPVFRAREAAYADTARACAWEREHVSALIRSARSGRPLPIPGRVRSAYGWVQGLLFS